MKAHFYILLSGIISFSNAFCQRESLHFSLEDVIVTATRIPNAYKTTSLDSDVVESAHKLSELLQDHSNIFVKTYGSGSLASVSFRGTGASHTNVLWNDISLNSVMNGQVDFSLFPTTFFDQVELHHGASGLLDGNGALGGSVNLMDQLSYNKGVHFIGQQSIGSFGSSTTSGELGFSNRQWSFVTKVFYKKDENDFSYTDISQPEKVKKTQANANLEQFGWQQHIYKKLKNVNLGFRFWYFDSHRLLPPSMLTTNNDESQKDKSHRVSIELEGLFKNLKYKWVNAFLHDHLLYTNKKASIISTSNSYFINSKLLTKYYWKNNLVLTNDVSIRSERAHSDGYDHKKSRFNNSWLVGLSKDIKQFQLNLFNRMSYLDKNVKPIAPSVGLQYGIFEDKRLLLKANAGINYNFPTFNDLFWNPGGNPDLKPEEAKMGELGINYLYRREKMSTNFELTGFHSQVNNWIIWLPSSNNIWTPDNLKNVVNQGIELSTHIDYRIGKMTILTGFDYTYTSSTDRTTLNQTDELDRKQLIYVPYHQFNFKINISLNNYSLNYYYVYTGRRFITEDNLWYLPANYLSNLSIGKKNGLFKNSELGISFRLNNLFNQEYQSIAWRGMPGRNYQLTISYIIK